MKIDKNKKNCTINKIHNFRIANNRDWPMFSFTPSVCHVIQQRLQHLDSPKLLTVKIKIFIFVAIREKENIFLSNVYNKENALFQKWSALVLFLYILTSLAFQVCEMNDGTKTLKLGDFGLATEVKEPLLVVCGTPTYVAPDILSENG